MKRQSFPGCPLYMMYRAACRTLHGLIEARGINPAEWFGGQPTDSMPKLNDADMKIVRNIIDQTVDEQVIQMEKNVVVLATAVTAAPFIGLMGTVWGVMDAFGGLAIQGTATLSAVAPGISGSLIATLAGLIVALPSLIGYNMLTSRIRILSTMMEHFAEELMADLTSVGGEKFALLCALAFRQCIAAHKLAADFDGSPIFFSKENFSNGCINTVDVTYPSSPFFKNLLAAYLEQRPARVAFTAQQLGPDTLASFSLIPAL
jgi:hypothetical protein